MPTYEYRCKDCGHTFDAYQAFTDDPLTECPECSGALKKLFGNVGIAFKGSGFYKTDSRSGSGSSSSSSSSSDGGSSSSDGGSSSESGSTKGDGGSKADSGSKATAATSSPSSSSSSSSD